jgi:hypothetical protein
MDRWAQVSISSTTSRRARWCSRTTDLPGNDRALSGDEALSASGTHIEFEVETSPADRLACTNEQPQANPEHARRTAGKRPELLGKAVNPRHPRAV